MGEGHTRFQQVEENRRQRAQQQNGSTIWLPHGNLEDDPSAKSSVQEKTIWHWCIKLFQAVSQSTQVAKRSEFLPTKITRACIAKQILSDLQHTQEKHQPHGRGRNGT